MFFVLEVANRFVHLLDTTTNPDGRWTTQQVRNLVMDLDDRATQFRFLVHGRAGQFTALRVCMGNWDEIMNRPKWASSQVQVR